eukprot:TRINITY_DN669_c0_g2_i1.p1 TRINITY_DN669_c0_g2~~TRINITY_DN669_c0_g2_i1.p1  ORF type:complete len:221 (+),score=29.32 TRINITY_DN669_c0_g2_i1:36-698(+)
MQYIITRHYKMGNSNLTQSHIKSYDYLLISIQLVNEIFRSKNFYSKYGYSTAFKYEPESFWSRLVPKLFWTSGSVHAIYYNDELKEGTTFEVVDQPLFLPKTAKVFEVKLLNIWKFEELVRLIKDSKLLANRKEVLNEEIKEKAIETTRGESSCVICDDNKEDIVLLCSVKIDLKSSMRFAKPASSSGELRRIVVPYAGKSWGSLMSLCADFGIWWTRRR